MFDKIISGANDALYSYILIIILVLGGLYFTFRTKFAQFRLFKSQIKSVMEKPVFKAENINLPHEVDYWK